MDANYQQISEWVLAYEGGYVNHPEDPGGATNKGITQRTYHAWLRGRGEAPRHVRQITMHEVRLIYRENYWIPCGGPHLPSGLDAAVYDFAVNSGVSRAVRYLQRLVGAKQDGIFGPMTNAAVREATGRSVDGVIRLIRKLCEARFAFVKSLRTFKTFGRGWTRRIMGERMGTQAGDIGIIDRATTLARVAPERRGRPVIPAPKQPAPGKAAARDMNPLAALFEAIAEALARIFNREARA